VQISLRNKDASTNEPREVLAALSLLFGKVTNKSFSL